MCPINPRIKVSIVSVRSGKDSGPYWKFSVFFFDKMDPKKFDNILEKIQNPRTIPPNFPETIFTKKINRTHFGDGFDLSSLDRCLDPSRAAPMCALHLRVPAPRVSKRLQCLWRRRARGKRCAVN